MTGDNQLDRMREDVHATAADLLETPTGTRTEAGLRLNVRVGVRYLEAWIHGSGAVPLYHMMEDAATAEISRTQLWQWIRHGATLDDGRTVTRELVARIVDEEVGAHWRGDGARAFARGATRRRGAALHEARRRSGACRVSHASGLPAARRPHPASRRPSLRPRGRGLLRSERRDQRLRDLGRVADVREVHTLHILSARRRGSAPASPRAAAPRTAPRADSRRRTAPRARSGSPALRPSRCSGSTR